MKGLEFRLKNLTNKLEDKIKSSGLVGFSVIQEEFLLKIVKKEENRKMVVIWGFWQDKLKKSEVNFASMLGSGVYFNSVEKILDTPKNKNDFYTISQFPGINKENSDIRYISQIPIMIEDEFQQENFDKVTDLIVGIIKEKHIPFFEQLTDLQFVNDEIIDKVPQMELGNYIPGKYMNPKKLIIMKLCDNPKYEEFKNWLTEIFEKVIKTEPDRYLEEYKNVLSTIDYLDSGKYLEVV
jgi:hypothetical protein